VLQAIAAAADDIRRIALSFGFDAVRIASPEVDPRAMEGYDAFIAAGAHGEMSWLANNRKRRADPRSHWPEVRSVLVLGANYGPSEDPLAILARPDRGAISVYAQGQDYHVLLKKRARALGEHLARAYGCFARLHVDTGPVLEKPLAAQAGLGWQGKHTNLVSREFGSWLFLAELFTDLDLPPDAPEVDHCGSCRNCLDICPTSAFIAPYQLDARRCVSYLTIEHKGHIPLEFRRAIGNRIYGCDDCLAVCPWNKFAQASSEMAFKPRAELSAPLLVELAALDDAGFRAIFAKNPIKRVGRDRFVRNVMIAIGNAADPSLLPTIHQALDDGSPLVRAMAAWALRQNDPDAHAALSPARRLTEIDRETREEWIR
jgi:epoxyqueuosine reductase